MKFGDRPTNRKTTSFSCLLQAPKHALTEVSSVPGRRWKSQVTQEPSNKAGTKIQAGSCQDEDCNQSQRGSLREER
jgi:hypothetical protein